MPRLEKHRTYQRLREHRQGLGSSVHRRVHTGSAGPIAGCTTEMARRVDIRRSSPLLGGGPGPATFRAQEHHRKGVQGLYRRGTRCEAPQESTPEPSRKRCAVGSTLDQWAYTAEGPCSPSSRRSRRSSPLRGVRRLLLDDEADRPLPKLCRVLAPSSHGSILSTIGASEKPGVVQSASFGASGQCWLVSALRQSRNGMPHRFSVIRLSPSRRPILATSGSWRVQSRRAVRRKPWRAPTTRCTPSASSCASAGVRRTLLAPALRFSLRSCPIPSQIPGADRVGGQDLPAPGTSPLSPAPGM